MRTILRFSDLAERKVVSNWPQVRRLIDNHGFPEGFMLGANSRAWFEDEVDAWLKSRPSASEAKPPLRGGAAQRVAAKREAEAAA
jgi:predicted DNA-binding transcriptional regulator AlpA